MEKLIAALGLSSKSIIGISVSSSNVVEIAVVDKKLHSVTKYAKRELKYNNAIREIISYDDFAEAVKELFADINVQPKGSHVVLNLPNVHFAFTSLPIMPDDQISTAISSEVDEMYLFKRHEPIISWNSISINKETDKMYIAYSAIQDNTMQNIKDVFSDLEIDLVAVENFNSSVLKGIIFGNVLEEELASSETTNVFLLNPNSFSILCLQGKKILDYYEEPLAIKSFSEEEVYDAIAKAAGGALENYPSQNLLVVSETDEISAEMLCHKITFDGGLKFLDRNMYTTTSFIPTTNSVLSKYAPYISLEVVGASVYSYDSYPLKFNFLNNAESQISSLITIPIGGVDYEIERKAVYTIGGAAAGIILFVGFLLTFFINLYEKKLYSDISSLEDQYTEYTAKVNTSKITGDGNDVFVLTKQLADFNKNEIDIYKALSTEIPQNIYLISFYSTSDGQIRIDGNSTSSDAIYAYVKGLKSKYPDIVISRLQFGYGEGTNDTSVYSFTIESEISRKKAAAGLLGLPNQNNNNDQPQDNNANPIGGLLNKIPNLPSAGQTPAPAQAPAPSTVPGDLPAPAAP